MQRFSVKASQYNHIEDKFVKKELDERWNEFEGFRIQRDMYSSFLIMNVNDKLDKINRDLCFERFKGFRKLHDIEINRLKNSQLSFALMNVI